MKRRTLYLVLVSVIVVCSVSFFLLNRKDKEQKIYIFDQHHNITLNDVEESLKITPSKASNSVKINLAQTSMIKSIDHKALKYFKSLEKMFPESKDLDEHFKMIKKYLLSQFPLDEATFIFETYKSYLTCEVDISKNIDMKSINSFDPLEVIEALSNVQNLRRLKMGDDLADALFGAQVKSSEYSIRKAAILRDDSLYGNEKEEALQTLNNDMWGDESDDVGKNLSAYNLYQEKLNIYKKDIEELGSEEKSEMIRNFRKDFFSEDAVKNLEAVESRREEEKNRESLYNEKEKEIVDSQDLDDDAKIEKIEALQDEIFGDDADNFRARLKLRVQ
ncbi:MAG: lipase chaperone [Desulfobacterales bacterium]|nr:lipase chaperone [Desulfobacterales bacterium]